MRFSTAIVAALPVAASAMAVARDEIEARQNVVTVVHTVTQGAPPTQPTQPVQVVTVTAGQPQQSQASQPQGNPWGHGPPQGQPQGNPWGQGRPSSSVVQQQPQQPQQSQQPQQPQQPSRVQQQSQQPQQTQSSQPSQQSSAPSSGGSSGSGGCPSDNSGHTSPGLNGKPAKSMVDSINYIRRLYNPQATCLQWSDSLATASKNCADAGSESKLRANSGVVSDPGYNPSSPYYSGSLASTAYEASMFEMLCQSPNDPELKGTCPGKVGEAGCSSGPCTGHHDMVVDAKNEQKYFGVGSNTGTKWLSCSFSSSE